MPAPPDRDAALRDIAGESVRMSRLIDNLLTLARADGGFQLHREPVRLGDLAESVCRQAAGQHPERELSFAASPAPPVAGDDDSLRQLLWILLDNALKFTSRRRSGSTVTQRADRVHLTVADDGVGIPPRPRAGSSSGSTGPTRPAAGLVPGWVWRSPPGSSGSTKAPSSRPTTTVVAPPSRSTFRSPRCLLLVLCEAWTKIAVAARDVTPPVAWSAETPITPPRPRQGGCRGTLLRKKRL